MAATCVALVSGAAFAGCGASPPADVERADENQGVPGEPGDHRGVAIGDRTFDIHVPEGLSTPAPAVLVLHGWPGDAEKARAASEFDTLSDEAGLLAVFPEARDDHWRVATDSWDVEYLTEVIDVLVADWKADPERIYLAGISNGGDMALAFAADHPDLVAGVAPVVPAGSGMVTAIVPSADQVVPTIALLGEFDPRFAGGDDLMRRWRSAGGCSPGEEPAAVPDAVGASFDCEDGTPVVVYTVTGGGHEWFGEVGDPDALSATRTIWEFFDSTMGE